jgi:hypothetical protein
MGQIILKKIFIISKIAKRSVIIKKMKKQVQEKYFLMFVDTSGGIILDRWV